MKILFIPGEYPFCYYYRGYLPGVYSDQMVVSDFLKKSREVDENKLIKQANEADVIVFQRPNKRELVALMEKLKARGKKIIFENDDTYSGVPLDRLMNYKQVLIAREQSKLVNKALQIADGAIASTNILAKEFKKINPNTVVLKNCIDPMDEFPCKENKTGQFRVGFIGSVTTNDDYLHIKEDIKKLDERGDVTIVVLGVKYKDGSHIPLMQVDYDFWSSLKNVEWHPYVHITEAMMTYSDLALDLAIIPRLDHYFNKCKSNLKFLEMSLLHIPVIAQGFKDGKSPYQGRDEPYMSVVVHGSWYEKIIDIKDNYPKYKELANKAHDYVLENYNIKNYAQEWVKQIKKLCKYQKKS